MTRYLYRVLDCDGEHYGVCGANYEPQFYWDDNDLDPDDTADPTQYFIEFADREHPSGAPHRWQRVVADAREEVKP